VAVDIHGKAKDTDNTHPIPPMILLNDGFLFEKGIIQDEEYNPLEKECLKSLESLCVFDYHEYYKNLLCILVEFYNRIYGKTTAIPKCMMDILGLNLPALISHMMRQGKLKKQEFLHSYKMIINRSKFIVHCCRQLGTTNARHMTTRMSTDAPQPSHLDVVLPDDSGDNEEKTERKGMIYDKLNETKDIDVEDGYATCTQSF
jgi:hypothetical protein